MMFQYIYGKIQSANKIVSRFYIMLARNAIARLPREVLASGQACEAGGRRCRS